jgi:hypothetical protein
MTTLLSVVEEPLILTICIMTWVHSCIRQKGEDYNGVLTPAMLKLPCSDKTLKRLGSVLLGVLE